MRNHGFLQCEKFDCLKFRHTEVIHKKLFLSFVKMHNCVWYLWTCPSQNTGLHYFGGQIGLGYFFGRKIDYSYFSQSIAPHDSKMRKWKEVLQRIIIRLSNFGPNWGNIGGFSLMGQGNMEQSSTSQKLLILFPSTKKNPPISRLTHQTFSPPPLNH